MKTMKLIQGIAAGVAMLAMVSCNSSKDVVYFQDMPNGAQEQLADHEMIKVQPGDQLSIMVYSDNPEMANTFNLTNPTNNTVTQGTQTGTGNMRAYTVDKDGDIKMPVLGEVNVGGLTRLEVAAKIEEALTKRNLLRNAVVNVEFYNLFVSVFGEVKEPQRVYIQKDELTLPDALSQCGDLTINGKRGTVKVIRDLNGKKKAMTVDMRSARSLYSSPAYYLQPNDLVYVEPNKQKSNESTVNGNSLKTPAFWISIGSFLTTVALLVLQINNNKK